MTDVTDGMRQDMIASLRKMRDDTAMEVETIDVWVQTETDSRLRMAARALVNAIRSFAEAEELLRYVVLSEAREDPLKDIDPPSKRASELQVGEWFRPARGYAQEMVAYYVDPVEGNCFYYDPTAPAEAGFVDGRQWVWPPREGVTSEG